jgi:hypothetical protein
VSDPTGSVIAPFLFTRPIQRDIGPKGPIEEFEPVEKKKHEAGNVIWAMRIAVMKMHVFQPPKRPGDQGWTEMDRLRPEEPL